MNSTKTFYIDKSTGTFADQLTAAGLMRLLAELVEKQTGQEPELTLVDQDAYYNLTCSPPIDLAALADFEGWVFPAPFLRTANQDDVPDDAPAVVDFEAEREKRGRFFEAYSALPQTAKQASMRGESDPALESLPPAPHPQWHIFRALNTPTSIIGYNNLIERWYNVYPHTGRALAILLDLFRQLPNDPENGRKAWRKLAKKQGWKIKSGGQATANQLFNPSQGKGINKTKTDSITLGNVKNFWLLEWLKAVGMYEMAMTRTMRGGSDRKTYVLAPGRIDLRTHRRIMDDFRHAMRFSETAVRSDILTVIRYLQAFIQYVAAAQEGELTDPPAWLTAQKTIRPASFIHGFHTAFYKDLGNAAATMNLAFLNLPGWVAIHNRDDRIAYQEILEEHEQIVRQLQEDRGDELALLQSYRNFIVADDLDPFFTFTNGYAHYIISQREKRGGYARQLSTNNLRRLIVTNNPQYSPILDNPGFQNVAYAIRQSTVTAQWRKKEGDRRYDVRYGLGQELTRKAQYEDEFIAALSDFLHKYNAENAQVMETRPGPYRRSIRTDDIQEIVRLIDEHGSDLVCKLLVAYGYARESRPEEPAAETTAESNTQ